MLLSIIESNLRFSRVLAVQLSAGGALNVVMVRYNAAHRGAEQDILPYLDRYNPGVASYTGTRWRGLLQKPVGLAKKGPIATAGMYYWFVLSNPHVDIWMTAPSHMRQLSENLGALHHGQLSAEEMEFMRTFGDGFTGGKGDSGNYS